MFLNLLCHLLVLISVLATLSGIYVFPHLCNFGTCNFLFFLTVQGKYMYLCEDDTAGEEGLVARAQLSENVNFKVCEGIERG